MKKYSIDAILPPWVFVKDKETGGIGRVNIGDFENSPKLNSEAQKNEDGSWTTLGNTTDPDCVGGVCPIR